MGVVNSQSLSLLLEIERSAAERVLCDLWGDYSKQQEQIIGRWMKMSGNNDSLALHELLQQLRPVGRYRTLKYNLLSQEVGG